MMGMGLVASRAARNVDRKRQARDLAGRSIGMEAQTSSEALVQVGSRSTLRGGQATRRSQGGPRAVSRREPTSDEGEPQAGRRHAMIAQVVRNGSGGSRSQGVVGGAQQGTEVARNQQEGGEGRGWRVRNVRLDEAKEQVHRVMAAQPARRGGCV